MNTKRALLASLWLVACGEVKQPPENPEYSGEASDDFFGDSPREAAHSALVPPPPLSGGTLAVAGPLAFAADPTLDKVHLYDVRGLILMGVDLQPGDEPGRVVATDAGRAYVALRGGGAVAVIEGSTTEGGELVDRWAVCAAPRGLALTPDESRLYVACADGRLLTLATADGAVLEERFIAPDLRDVVAVDDKLYLSTFRQAHIYTLSGDTLSEIRLPSAQLMGLTQDETYTPGVAWRMKAVGGRPLLVHQRMQATTLATGEPPVYYAGGGCGGGVVHGVVSDLSDPGVADAPAPGLSAVLPVDLALSQGPNPWLVVAAAGIDAREGGGWLRAYRPSAPGDLCAYGDVIRLTEQPVAVEWIAADRLFVQLRSGAAIVRVEYDAFDIKPIAIKYLEDHSVERDTGYEVFHEAAGGTTACASCHPEGQDDGHVWRFPELGARRTQSLAGGITAPFHWDGDLPDLAALSHEVLERRMLGRPLTDDHLEALGAWMKTIPAPVTPWQPPEEAARVEAGEEAFVAADCDRCHRLDGSVDPASHDVGTGAAFQVPALTGISVRAPYMHDGCAPTLEARFDLACGGGQHGDFELLSPGEQVDLLAFLRSR